MNNFSHFLLLIIICCTFSCNNKNDAPAQKNEAYINAIDTLQIANSINLKSRAKLTLQAKTAVEQWSFYTDLTKKIDSIPSKTLGQLKNNLEKFATLYQNEEAADEAEISQTPPEVKTNAIDARLLAIKTQVHILQNLADMNEPDPSKISNHIGELQNAYQDLNVQLNELFNTSVKDLLEEIREENKLESSSSEDDEEDDEEDE